VGASAHLLGPWHPPPVARTLMPLIPSSAPGPLQCRALVGSREIWDPTVTPVLASTGATQVLASPGLSSSGQAATWPAGHYPAWPGSTIQPGQLSQGVASV